MGREVTSTVVLQALVQFAARFPKDASTDCVTVAGDALEFQAKPVVALGRIVFEQDGRAAVVGDDHIQRTVIVVIAYGQPRDGNACSKVGPAFEVTFVSFPSGP